MPKLWLLVMLIGTDQLTKILVTNTATRKFGHRLLGINVHGNADHISIIAFVLLIGLYVATFLVDSPNWHTKNQTFPTLILSGASSNILEYLHRGFVIDWISTAGSLVFNLADLYIVLGIGFAICVMGRDFLQECSHRRLPHKEKDRV